MANYSKLKVPDSVKWLLLLLFALVVFYCWSFQTKILSGYFIIYMVLANLFTCFLFWFIVRILMWLSGYPSLKLMKIKGMDDFIIGDEGGYSLSRLQALIWAITVISYLIVVQLGLFLRNDIDDHSVYFDPVLSESALWLLGLSLASTITVKGITVETIKKDPARMLRKANRSPKLIDIVMNDNGLDFSKCQMLVWTIIAVVVFNYKVYQYSSQAYYSNPQNLGVMFNNFHEDYSEKTNEEQTQIKKEKIPYIPYLPWTFIVLMGLSQGTYIGKKLVPNFKISDIKEIKEQALKTEKDEMETKKLLLSQIISNSKKQLTTVDQKNIENLENELKQSESRVQELNSEIEEIEKYNI